jgi:hypothetical protein
VKEQQSRIEHLTNAYRDLEISSQSKLRDQQSHIAELERNLEISCSEIYSLKNTNLDLEISAAARIEKLTSALEISQANKENVEISQSALSDFRVEELLAEKQNLEISKLQVERELEVFQAAHDRVVNDLQTQLEISEIRLKEEISRRKEIFTLSPVKSRGLFACFARSLN